MQRLVLIGSSLLMFGCDPGGDAAQPEVAAAAEVGPISVLRVVGAGRERAPISAPAKAPAGFRPRLRHPLDGATLDNVSCEAAAALPDDGAIAVPMEGGPGTGCLASTGDQRYFTIAVGPGEVVTVTSPEGRATSLWMSVSPACGATSDGTCGDDWAALWGGVAIANPGDLPIERVVAVHAEPRAELDTFDLEVTRARIADHSRCESARPLTAAGLTGERMSRAAVTPTDADHWFPRVLWYRVEVPPMTRVVAQLGDGSSLGLALLDGCDDATPGVFPELANATSAPVTAIVQVGAQWQVEDRFELGVAFEPLGADASCEQPRRLAAGESAIFDIAGGDSGPGTCWCFAPRRVGHVAIPVPAGGSVVASALTVMESGAQLIEVPEACADTCGDTFASGWGASPAEVVLGNEGDTEVVRHFIVTANEVWTADGTDSTFPPVTVTVSASE